MLLFVPPYCRCHDDGRFRFTVIGYGLWLAVTSRFLWTAPYTNEILDVDTSKRIFKKYDGRIWTGFIYVDHVGTKWLVLVDAVMTLRVSHCGELLD